MFITIKYTFNNKFILLLKKIFAVLARLYLWNNTIYFHDSINFFTDYNNQLEFTK